MSIESNLAKLPAKAFCVNKYHCTGPYGEPDLIMVERGESQYMPIYKPGSFGGDAQAYADQLNASGGCSKAQAQAMLMGSMFGWGVPAANVDNYDENGVMK